MDKGEESTGVYQNKDKTLLAKKKMEYWGDSVSTKESRPEYCDNHTSLNSVIKSELNKFNYENFLYEMDGGTYLFDSSEHCEASIKETPKHMESEVHGSTENDPLNMDNESTDVKLENLIPLKDEQNDFINSTECKLKCLDHDDASLISVIKQEHNEVNAEYIEDKVRGENCQFFVDSKYSKSLLKDRPKYRKSHICNVCDKIFNTPSKLKRHTVVHTGIRKFSCIVCQKGLVLPEI